MILLTNFSNSNIISFHMQYIRARDHMKCMWPYVVGASNSTYNSLWTYVVMWTSLGTQIVVECSYGDKA